MSASKGACIFAALVFAVLLITPALNATAQTVNREILQKFFGCPECVPSTCPPPTPPGCQTVLEPGMCGCCQVCARAAGESCGLASGRCGRGLSCRPRPGDPDPLGAFLDGTAVCV